MSTFEKPKGGIPFHFEEGELPDPPENLGDRIGEYVPEVGAEIETADADRRVTEARIRAAADREIRREPETPELRAQRKAELARMRARYGNSSGN